MKKFFLLAIFYSILAVDKLHITSSAGAGVVGLGAVGVGSMAGRIAVSNILFSLPKKLFNSDYLRIGGIVGGALGAASTAYAMGAKEMAIPVAVTSILGESMITKYAYENDDEDLPLFTSIGASGLTLGLYLAYRSATRVCSDS